MGSGERSDGRGGERSEGRCEEGTVTGQCQTDVSVAGKTQAWSLINPVKNFNKRVVILNITVCYVLRSWTQTKPLWFPVELTTHALFVQIALESAAPRPGVTTVIYCATVTDVK